MLKIKKSNIFYRFLREEITIKVNIKIKMWVINRKSSSSCIGFSSFLGIYTFFGTFQWKVIIKFIIHPDVIETKSKVIVVQTFMTTLISKSYMLCWFYIYAYQLNSWLKGIHWRKKQAACTSIIMVMRG